ncbi:hypothetical protein [Flavobacterium lacus]|uniref:Uncharacterized protein n=1 Tax=Flavobacterium lacus TaxID=1353778 RepID=A0A328WQ22_9FLAO|nr:hypothetical protein [Flavobacterium lacus]RAR46447.1 hypothetical protein B0I10_1196 [Flavobacterium lacus]
MESFKEELTQFFDMIEAVPQGKRYWIVRTEGGEYFESFTNFNFVAIGHEEITLKKVDDLKKASKNLDELRLKLKTHIENILPDRNAGLMAGQIVRFIYEMKKGDIVVVPSEGSAFISIGEVQQTLLLEVTDLDLDRTGCPYRKRKKIRWHKTVSKKSSDILLRNAMQSHQALNDITHYGDIVERSISDFFKIDDETSIIINVNRESNVPAPDLLYFGSDILRFTEGFIKHHNLHFDVSDIQIKINVNSEGKTQFISKNGRLILLVGLVIIGLTGGGLTIDVEGFNMDLSTDGLISKIIEYQNNNHDRAMQKEILEAKDSLQISNNEDLLKYLKQFAINKDKPK